MVYSTNCFAVKNLNVSFIITLNIKFKGERGFFTVYFFASTKYSNEKTRDKESSPLVKNDQFVKHFLIVNEGLRAGSQSQRANGEGGQPEQPMGGLFLWGDKGTPFSTT